MLQSVMTGSRAHDISAPSHRPAPACVALVHDYLLVMRGAERTFAAIAECWPSAAVYTLLFDPNGTNGTFAGRRVHASSLQRLGVHQNGFRRLLPLFPAAAERLGVAGHDLVISSSSAFAHGVRPDDDALHLCYCYTPFRYAWFERDEALREAPRALRPAVARLLERIRRWDLEASRRVDHYIAISELSRQRIEAAYGRAATVVHPPVETSRFAPGNPEDFFLVVTELLPHKRVEVALEAARRARRPIKVVGAGPDLSRLRARYGDTAEFLGRTSDEALADLYARALAVIVPKVEEFGITAVEAQAAGRPVVGPDVGGTLETVIDGITGVLVPPEDVDALAEALTHVDFNAFDPSAAVEQASRFSRARFQERFRAEVAKAWARRP
ncbi:MAG: glycosyltransferase [Actinomycetota bacterium]|nr:glycosyltransferase [Actinomycetota bacterium]